MKEKIDPKARFWLEAQVALAKSAIFLVTSEDELKHNNFISASISVYYSLFHFSLCLMWLLPERLPDSLRKALIEIRDSGCELPDKIISHQKVENFLCAGQFNLPVKGLSELFIRAQELREFTNYGPRVTYINKKPTLGPCHFNISQLITMISEIHKIFPVVLKLVFPKTAYKGNLGPIIVSEAILMLDQSDLHFSTWSSKKIISSAKKFLSRLNRERDQNYF